MVNISEGLQGVVSEELLKYFSAKMEQIQVIKGENRFLLASSTGFFELLRYKYFKEHLDRYKTCLHSGNEIDDYADSLNLYDLRTKERVDKVPVLGEIVKYAIHQFITRCSGENRGTYEMCRSAIEDNSYNDTTFYLAARMLGVRINLYVIGTEETSKLVFVPHSNAEHFLKISLVYIKEHDIIGVLYPKLWSEMLKESRGEFNPFMTSVNPRYGREPNRPVAQQDTKSDRLTVSLLDELCTESIEAIEQSQDTFITKLEIDKFKYELEGIVSEIQQTGVSDAIDLTSLSIHWKLANTLGYTEICTHCKNVAFNFHLKCTHKYCTNCVYKIVCENNKQCFECSEPLQEGEIDDETLLNIHMRQEDNKQSAKCSLCNTTGQRALCIFCDFCRTPTCFKCFNLKVLSEAPYGSEDSQYSFHCLTCTASIQIDLSTYNLKCNCCGEAKSILDFLDTQCGGEFHCFACWANNRRSNFCSYHGHNLSSAVLQQVLGHFIIICSKCNYLGEGYECERCSYPVCSYCNSLSRHCPICG